MINVVIEKISSHKVIVDLEIIKKLVNTAKKVENVKLIENEEDITTGDLMRLAEKSGAFDFLKDKREDIYTIDDLKVKY